MNLDEFSDIGTHLIALCALINNASYFDSFGVEHISKEIKILINLQLYCADIFVLDLLIFCLNARL